MQYMQCTESHPRQLIKNNCSVFFVGVLYVLVCVLCVLLSGLSLSPSYFKIWYAQVSDLWPLYFLSTCTCTCNLGGGNPEWHFHSILEVVPWHKSTDIDCWKCDNSTMQLYTSTQVLLMCKCKNYWKEAHYSYLWSIHSKGWQYIYLK